MTSDEFWQTIERVKTVAPDQAERAEHLAAALRRLSTDDICDFAQLYQQHIDNAYTWELWGAAFVMMGGCSDDSFDYFRDWLISEGASTYEAAVRTPDSLADLGRLDDFPELEEFRYVADAIHEEKTGNRVPDFPSSGAHDPSGVEWDEDTVSNDYPKLAAIYGEHPL